MTKKPQLYANGSKVRINWYGTSVEATIAFKNGGQYTLTVISPKTGKGFIEHFTELRLTKAIQEAEIMDSPLYELMSEMEESDG